MSTRDFYVKSRPTRLGARLGGFGQRHMIQSLRRKYNVQRVLEIGAGKGIAARICREFGIQYLGIDGSEVAVQAGAANGVRVLHTYVPPMPDLEGFQPDLVLTIDVLSNVPSYRDAEEFVAAVASCLKPGGLFLAIAPDLRYARWFFWDPDLTRQFLTTRHRLGRLLYAAGFDIIESTYRLDGIGSPWCHLIYHATKLVPYRLLEGLTNRWSRRDLALYPSMWEMIYRKAPSAYVLGRRRGE
jgi:SAM-dependent methyltransferase